MKILTLTACPAFDIHLSLPHLSLLCENTADSIRRDAGGKGINISRALTANGIPNRALVVLGKQNSADFTDLLASFGIDFLPLVCDGRIRENITIHHDGGETRISAESPDAPAGLADCLFDTVRREIGEDGADTVLTVTGRLPRGVSPLVFGDIARETGVGLVIDSRSFTPDDLKQVHPWLIKPNAEEIGSLFGCPVSTLPEAARAAERLRHSLGIDNVMVSLGASGAVLACKDGIFMTPAPPVSVESTVGAGDSSIAGFLAAKSRGASAVDCLRTAVAYGSAACEQVGTAPPTPSEIIRLRNLSDGKDGNLACRSL